MVFPFLVFGVAFRGASGGPVFRSLVSVGKIVPEIDTAGLREESTKRRKATESSGGEEANKTSVAQENGNPSPTTPPMGRSHRQHTSGRSV